jgi:hypothetical protein
MGQLEKVCAAVDPSTKKISSHRIPVGCVRRGARRAMCGPRCDSGTQQPARSHAVHFLLVAPRCRPVYPHVM